MTRIVFWLPALVGLSLLAGCSGASGPKGGTATIIGKVLLDGNAVADGEICFIGQDGIPHQSKIFPDGSYRVENVPVGEAIVTVIDAPPPGEAESMMILKQNAEKGGPSTPPPPKTVIPKKYGDEKTSDLRYDVKLGENNWDAPLTR